MRTLFTTLSLLGLSLGASAQSRTLIVDAAGGPSVFTDIQPAVDAARDGDTILVRKGSYSGFRVNFKGVSILADAGAVVNQGTFQSVIISDRVTAPTSRRVVLRGLNFNVTTPSQLSVIGHPGTVVLDNIVTGRNMDLFDFTNASLVHIENSAMGGMLMFQGRTTGVIVGSNITGVTQALSTKNEQNPTIRANGETGHSLYIAASNVTGAAAISNSTLPGAAIDGNGRMRIVLRGDGSHRIAAGQGIQAQPAIRGPFVGTAELVYDPSLVITAAGMAVPIAWSGTTTRRPGPSLTHSVNGTGGTLGSILTLEHRAPAAMAHALLFGLPNKPQEIQPFGELALVPQSLAVIATGGGGVVNYKIPVPNVLALRGAMVGWQSLAVSFGAAPQLSNGSWTVLH